MFADDSGIPRHPGIPFRMRTPTPLNARGRRASPGLAGKGQSAATQRKKDSVLSEENEETSDLTIVLPSILLVKKKSFPLGRKVKYILILRGLCPYTTLARMGQMWPF